MRVSTCALVYILVYRNVLKKSHTDIHKLLSTCNETISIITTIFTNVHKLFAGVGWQQVAAPVVMLHLPPCSGPPVASSP